MNGLSIKRLRNMEFIAFIFLLMSIFSLKVGNAKTNYFMPTASNDSKLESADKSLVDETSKKSEVSSYFRHEPNGQKSYAFGYEVNDNKTGNRQFRDERSSVNGSVEGSYGYVRPDGKIMITRYSADAKTGYTSQTHIFDVHDAKGFQFGERMSSDSYEKVFYDNATHLNFTADKVSENMANALSTEHGIEINHIDLAKDLLSPSLLNIVSGKVPLEKIETKNNESQKLGFQTFQEAIPKQFPIVPFELPQKSNDVHLGTTSNSKDVGESEPRQNNKTSNDEHKVDWISKIVNETRNEFLENIPNLL